MRVKLGGKGSPIPLIALPDPLLGDVPNQILTLENGVPFKKEDWVGLGYTHFEAFCVGGSGGRGGDLGAGNGIYWNERKDPSIRFPYSPEEWAAVVNIYARAKPAPGHQSIYYTGGYWLDASWYRVEAPPPGYPGAPAAGTWIGWRIEQHGDYSTNPPTRWETNTSIWALTAPQYADFVIPDRSYSPILYHHSYLSGIVATGGGGGGGGFHAINGELDDLPDSVPVVIGTSGIDAEIGARVTSPTIGPTPVRSLYWNYGDTFGVVAQQDFYPPNSVYPEASKLWTLPGSGQDGGFSSFGDICQASGGKGGGPSAIFNGTNFEYPGIGGDGGLGGRTIAGGGGKGSNSSANGSDGSWDGVVGGGGGGGRGGAFIPGSINPNQPATDGGRGAFSYTDTSIYGARHTKILPNRPLVYSYHPVTGAVIGSYPMGFLQGLFSPGTGGGVRVLRKMKFGSDTVSYSPNGAVILRLSKRD